MNRCWASRVRFLIWMWEYLRLKSTQAMTPSENKMVTAHVIPPPRSSPKVRIAGEKWKKHRKLQQKKENKLSLLRLKDEHKAGRPAREERAERRSIAWKVIRTTRKQRQKERQLKCHPPTVFTSHDYTWQRRQGCYCNAWRKCHCIKNSEQKKTSKSCWTKVILF